MSDYEVEIEGKFSLVEINEAIAGEETMSAEFISSRVDASETGVTNQSTFHKLPPGTSPKPLAVVPQDVPKPPGTKKVWSGEMIVEGKFTSVIAYREV